MNAISHFVVIAAAVMLAAADGGAMSAREIIEKAEAVSRGDTQSGVVAITIKTRRWTRTMRMKVWDHRAGKRSFSEIIAPQKDAGNRFLMIDKTMWHYVPALQREIKISPSMMLQSWMGSDFTNDDIVKESSIVDDYTHVLEGEETVEGHRCHRVRLTPKPGAAVVWGSIVYHARVADCLPVRQDYYSEQGELKKRMTMGDFRRMDDRVIPTRIRMETVGKKDRYTLLEVEKVRFNRPLGGEIFTIQNLKRR